MGFLFGRWVVLAALCGMLVGGLTVGCGGEKDAPSRAGQRGDRERKRVTSVQVPRPDPRPTATPTPVSREAKLVAAVRRARMGYDPSISLGNVIDNYAYFESSEWSAAEGLAPKVTVVCPYVLSKITNHDLIQLYNDEMPAVARGDVEKELAGVAKRPMTDFVKSATVRLHFTVRADGAAQFQAMSMEIVTLEGKSADIKMDADMRRYTFEDIYGNAFPRMLLTLFGFIWK